MTKFQENSYVLGDAFDYLPNIPSESVDLVFTSCPDLSQTPFGKDETDSYRQFQQKAMREFARIVKPTGVVVVCQTDRRVNGFILSNHMWYAQCLENEGLRLKDYKVVVRNEVGKRDMYYFTFQHMLVYTSQGVIHRKGDWLRDIYVDQQEKVLNQSVWSQDFCKYVIENLTEPGDLVVDPFAGVAPVLLAASTTGRRWWGCELEEKFYDPTFNHSKATLPL